MTASEDELQQQTVRVPGTAVCGLPSHPLPACLPSLCLPASLFSLSPSPSSSLPLPASVYLIDVGLGAAVLCGGTFLVSSLILLPLEQKENWLPVVQHLPLKPGEQRGGKRVLCIPGCLCRQWACSVTSLEMPLNCCQIPLSAVQMEFNALPWLDAHSVRGGRNGTVSPPWRSISNLPCAMIIWVLDHASLPSSAHHLLYFSFIVPGISGSDMEAFQRGAARQDSFWGEEGCTFGLFMWDCALATTHL